MCKSKLGSIKKSNNFPLKKLMTAMLQKLLLRTRDSIPCNSCGLDLLAGSAKMAKICNKFCPHLDWNKMLTYCTDHKMRNQYYLPKCIRSSINTLYQRKYQQNKEEKLVFIFTFRSRRNFLLQLVHRFRHNILRGLKVSCLTQITV